MIELKPYLYFQKALEFWIDETGTGYQKILSIGTEYGKSYISQLLNPERKKPIPFEAQVKIADACGYDYLSFLRLGKQLYEGEPPQDISKKIVSTDPAVEILNECIREAGVGDQLNDRQKQALLKIIRDELKSAEEKAKKDIKKFLNVLRE
jgi:hypothetical protein